MIERFRVGISDEEYRKLAKAHLAESPRERMDSIANYIHNGFPDDRIAIVQYFKPNEPYSLVAGPITWTGRVLPNPEKGDRMFDAQVFSFTVRSNWRIINGSITNDAYSEQLTFADDVNKETICSICTPAEKKEEKAKNYYGHTDLIKKWNGRFLQETRPKVIEWYTCEVFRKYNIPFPEKS